MVATINAQATRQRLLGAQQDLITARVRYRTAVRLVQQIEEELRQQVMPRRLLVMVGRSGNHRHLARFLPDGTAMSLCGRICDVERTERARKYGRGTIRRRDCAKCAEALLARVRQANRG